MVDDTFVLYGELFGEQKCVDDISELQFFGIMNGVDFSFLTVEVTRCSNQTNSQCKSDEEIDQFLNNSFVLGITAN